MAAPTATVRLTPAGYKMPDGYQMEIVFASVPNLAIWEKAGKPPGIDGGEPINTSTMINAAWHTMSPRHLKTLTPFTISCAYDPDVLITMYSLVNFKDAITFLFPEASTLAFWGFLQKFEPEELKEGEFPLANCTICPTNWDPNNNTENGPIYTQGAL